MLSGRALVQHWISEILQAGDAPVLHCQTDHVLHRDPSAVLQALQVRIMKCKQTYEKRKQTNHLTVTVIGMPARVTCMWLWFTTCPFRWLCTRCSCFISPPASSCARSTPCWSSSPSSRWSSCHSGKVRTAKLVIQWLCDALPFVGWEKFSGLVSNFLRRGSNILLSFSGVLLALLEQMGYILPICDDKGQKVQVNPGQISAGYQNFLVCIEMLLAAIALRYAFPISVYVNEGVVNSGGGRSVTMQSISSSLKVNRKLCPNRKWLHLFTFCRKQWIQGTSWPMPFTIFIRSINNIRSTVRVSDPPIQAT